MLRIAGHTLDPQLIILDKDGTLIAFDAMWHTWFDAILRALPAKVILHEETWQGLAGTLGYDRQTGAWDPHGPLTIASTKEINLLMASQLYRYQHQTWDEALGIVARAEETARAALREADLVQPIGNVHQTLACLRQSGLSLALATTDDRAATLHILERLGIRDLLATLVCGDDGFPLKPAPDMALEICRRLSVAPAATMMIGDTIGDMTMARRAGLGWAVGVTSGIAGREALAPHADLIIPDIHAIEVLEDQP